MMDGKPSEICRAFYINKYIEKSRIFLVVRGEYIGITCCVTNKPNVLVARFRLDDRRVKILKVIF